MSQHPEYTPRPSYEQLPGGVRQWVEQTLGSPVTHAVPQVGGFSPGCAVRLQGRDGSRIFLKAASGLVNRDTQQMYRWEIQHLAALPPEAPAPRLLATYDEQPWVALLIEDLDGRQPVLPWQRDDLIATLDAVRATGQLRGPGTPRVADQVDAWHGFRRLVQHPDQVASWPGVPEHLERFADLEAHAAAALAGNRLVHGDVRADNVLIVVDRAWLVDWAWTASGPAWFDVVAMAAPVALSGGPTPDDLLRAADISIEHHALAATVAALAGMFIERSLQPPPPGLPTVRNFQRAQGQVALTWLLDIVGAGR